MRRTLSLGAVVVGLAVLGGLAAGRAEERRGVTGTSLEPVQGQDCHTMGDDETPTQAKQAAEARAREQAVSSYRVYVQSASTVKNFQLEDDVILNLSAGMLEQARTTFEEKGRVFCAAVTAKLNPARVEEEIQKQVKAKEIAQQAQQPLLAAGSAFGVRVWTAKPDGRFVEGEALVVSVQSDRDGYLKLDYYQADGTVVHLVPNLFGGEAFIRAGRVYTFGGPGGRETFTITGPFGAEAIKALVSSQPFDQALTASRDVEDSRGYLQGLTRGLRGAAVGVGSGAAAPSQWAEASTGLMTASRAVVEHSRTRGIGRRPTPPEPAKPTPITGTVGERPMVPDSPRP